jgi:uncharacterized protein YggE
MKNKTLFFISILVIASLLSACGASQVQNPNQQYRSLFINGTGIAEISPDIAYVNIGVHTEAASAVTAVSMNNTKSQKILDALVKLGVLAKDLRTSNFSIATLQKTDPISGKVTGTVYAVDNNVIVTVRDLTKLGDLLDKSIQAGANNINNVQFDLSDNTAALKSARGDAVKDAIKQAEQIAKAAGITLGAIQNISYYESVPVFSGPNSYMDYGKGGGGGTVRNSVSVPVNPGQITINATVTITYAIK